MRRNRGIGYRWHMSSEMARHDHDRAPPARVTDKVAAVRAAGLFRALGDVERLRLLACLAEQEWCVSELAEAADATMSTISQRLRVLRQEGLVLRRREGKHMYYSVADQHVSELVSNAIAHAAEGTGPRP